MKSIKTTWGLFFALLPILYCGGLAYFFWGTPDRVENAIGLPSGVAGSLIKQVGPTVLGLGAFAMLFAFGFVVRVMRATSGRTPKATPGQIEVEDGEPFDADAALARYMAKKAAGEFDTPVAPMPTPNAPPSRGGFGRKAV